MTPEPKPLCVGAAFAGKHVLLTGASGFLGKVWLAMMLERAPEVGRIYVLLRSKALVSARGRFEKILNTSPAFSRLHERFGPRLSSFIAAKVEIIEGEISEAQLMMPPLTVARLQRDLDLVVHCAGLVDFDPDLRKALAANVDGTLHVADFVQSCDHAALLHVSTSYVAGSRQGAIPECVQAEYVPVESAAGAPFDAAVEVEAARAAAAQVVVAHSSPEHVDALRAQAQELVRELRAQAGQKPNEKLVANLVKRRLREELKQALSAEGMRRANHLGWPNTYTYTKSLAESLLARRRGLRLSIVRPSIVESSVEFPFPGWNESFNGSAPLAYVMGTWFRMVPARPDAPFDVIPVDMVCKAMSIAGAALLVDRHAPVYHVGSSYRHRCSVGRAAELIVLSHRRHYRGAERTRAERLFKSRCDAVLVEPDNAFSIGRNRSLVAGAREALELLPDKLQRYTKRWRERLERVDGKLEQIEKMVRLYLPFMYENYYVFESRALDATPALEPEFRFEPERLDWRTYWLDVHMPGLRRWAFPLIEGKKPERHRPAYPVRLGADAEPADVGQAAE